MSMVEPAGAGQAGFPPPPCIPRKILAKVIVVKIPQDEIVVRSFRVFRTVEAINFCDVTLLRSRIFNGPDAWEITLILRLVVGFVVDGKERFLRRLIIFRKKVPYPLTDELINFRALKSRVLVSDLDCAAEIIDGNNVILTETTFTVTVLALDDEVITVCELPYPSDLDENG